MSYKSQKTLKTTKLTSKKKRKEKTLQRYNSIPPPNPLFSRKSPPHSAGLNVFPLLSSPLRDQVSFSLRPYSSFLLLLLPHQSFLNFGFNQIGRNRRRCYATRSGVTVAAAVAVVTSLSTSCFRCHSVLIGLLHGGFGSMRTKGRVAQT